MRGLIIFSNDMEDVEALATRALLIRSGYQIDSLTFNKTKNVKTAFGLDILADYLKDDIDVNTYDFLIIPGGKYVDLTVDDDNQVKSLAKAFNANNKLICAICAGPRFLGQAKLLNGVKYTAYTGSETDMPKGIYYPHKKVVTDGLFITARGAGVVYDFVYEIVRYFSGKEAAQKLLKNILYKK
ncbi:DJ-1/PfpI family protein [Mycoplasmatota bacterium]|nr:DJ-1/PfpI family protein [Mycoplasmatota bacterium]